MAEKEKGTMTVGEAGHLGGKKVQERSEIFGIGKRFAAKPTTNPDLPKERPLALPPLPRRSPGWSFP